MYKRIGTGLCTVAVLFSLPAPSSAAPLPFVPPPVNSCGETGFDPARRQPDPNAPPPPLIPPLPDKIDIPIPYPQIVPVPQYGPLPSNTRVTPPAPADPCLDPCPELTDAPDVPGPAGSSASGGFRIPQIQIRPDAEPIPIPIPGGPPPAPQPAPPAVVNPAEPGPVAAPVAAPAVGDVRLVQQLTGHGSENRTDKRYGVDGTDLGIMWESKPGQVAVAFGDSFGKGWQFGVPGGPDWRSNILGHSTDKNLADGMAIDSMVQDGPCHAAEVISSRKIKNYEMTTIPTSGFAIGDRQYTSYMSVSRWSVVPGMWYTNYGGVAYSDDNGQTWTKDQHAKWENIFGLNKFQVSTMVPQGEYVYMFGTPNGRIGSIGLARVKTKDVLNTSAYQYWVDGTWAPTAKNDATPIMSGTASELSVRYDEPTKTWQLTTLDTTQGKITLRTAATPQGAWSAPVTLVDTTEYPKAYGGFIHPWSTDKDLYFTISEWDSYNVYLMHARLN